ncbi:hypothetical protein ABLE91_15845 [Aquabacter sp. CN5-332]|uniref:hypothetical protein n=1 Tax=Aquabacter sp. CN5-332 TaxID=3156608 RepID=UPI0032B496D4
MSLATYLSSLQQAAEAAEAAERAFRTEAEARTKALAAARSEAYRRINFLRPLAEMVGGAESPDVAVLHAQAYLRTRLGWDETTPAREEVLTRFAPVALAIHFALAEGEPPEGTEDAPAAMATFEDWYAQTRESSFWYLFEHYMRETPLVDF